MGLIVGVLVLGGIGAGFVALRAWPMINMVETGRTPNIPMCNPALTSGRWEKCSMPRCMPLVGCRDGRLSGMMKRMGKFGWKLEAGYGALWMTSRFGLPIAKARPSSMSAPPRGWAAEILVKTPGTSADFRMNWRRRSAAGRLTKPVISLW